MTMNIDKLTKLPPIELGFRVDPHLPVLSLSMQVQKAGCSAAHQHPRGQLVFASQGVMRVVSGSKWWIVPPSEAVWIPPHTEHEVYFPGQVTLGNLFIDPKYCKELTDSCIVIKVTTMLRELILKTITFGEHYAPHTSQWRLIHVMLDELKTAEASMLNLPMGHDPRLLNVMEALLSNPCDKRELEDWAKTAGASARTLARLFVKETGLTFGVWRKRLTLQTAIDRISQGHSISKIAEDLGYLSQSAFIEMFRQNLGVTPGAYAKTHSLC